MARRKAGHLQQSVTQRKEPFPCASSAFRLSTDQYRWLPIYRPVRKAKANPEAIFKHGLTTWWPTTGAEIVEQFRAGMMDRINEAVPYSQRGRAEA